MIRWNIDKTLCGGDWQQTLESEMDINLYKEWLNKRDAEDLRREVPWSNWLVLRLDLQENGQI